MMSAFPKFCKTCAYWLKATRRPLGNWGKCVHPEGWHPTACRVYVGEGATRLCRHDSWCIRHTETNDDDNR